MRALLGLCVLTTAACIEAHAQPRPRDGGVRDATVRDAGVRDSTVRDAAVRDADRARDAASRDVAPDVVPRPPTHGRVDPREVQRILATKTEDIRGCYRNELQHDDTLRGEVIVRVRVEDDGSVSETSSGGDPPMLRVGRCIESVLRTLRFPRPTGGPATVAAPFVFQPGEG